MGGRRGRLGRPPRRRAVHALREKAVGHLGDLIGRACTINEPNVVTAFGYLLGFFPPGAVDPARFAAATDNFLAAHNRAVPC